MKKIAVANRGEVACRIIKTCRRMGYKSILLHSKPDESSLAFRQADETFCIGEGPASESYLDAEKIVKACVENKVDALHPGFGFLSENSEFAQLCFDHQILFIGPTPENIAMFGNKNKAKELCIEAQVPTLPYFFSQAQDLEVYKTQALKIQYPVLIKALHGGGGRGMRIVRSADEFQEKFESAKKESLSCFANDQVFIEKYLESPKHIEVQIFGDSQNFIWTLGERECSVQRRHQKMIEEAPSPSINETQRLFLMDVSRNLAKTAGYKNAGTVEYLFDGQDFYFLEMNTRLQVEHPVTEKIYNIDLVEAQIKTCFGENLEWDLKKLRPQGHAIECRICAENEEGMPSIGPLKEFVYTGRERFDTGFETYDQISSFYDSMIAKLIVYSPDRKQAVKLMTQELKNISFGGIELNINLLHQILNHPDFKDASMTTDFMSQLSIEQNPTLTQGGSPQLSHVRPQTVKQEISPFLKKPSFSSNFKTDSVFKSKPIYITFEEQSSQNQNSNKLLAPLPGKILKIYKKEGEMAKAGETLILLEAMKMEHQLKSPREAKILKINIKETMDVPIDFELLVLENETQIDSV